MSSPEGEPQADPPGPSRRGRWIVLFLAVFASPLVAEAGLRFLLFSDSALARKWGAEVRKAALFVEANTHDDFWMLREYIQVPEERRFTPPERYHPLLGWVNEFVDPITYDHRHRPFVGDKRPVLLYGASYAAREYRPMLGVSDLAEDYVLLPYGVGGYGVDQVYLLLKNSLDHFVGTDPVVLIGLTVDGDFDRCMLSLRVWPKPHFSLDDGGALRLETPIVEDIRTYFERNRIGINSYIWSHLKYGKSLPEGLRGILSGEAQRRRKKQELIRALVVAMQAELDARGMQGCYLLFCGQSSVKGYGPEAWREEFLCGLFDELEIPYVLTRPVLDAALEEHGERPRQYFFGPVHPQAGHPNPLGRERLFPCLRSAIVGDYDNR
ncbi:MAG: hypothetical protein AAF682_05415 [Planctomycetota bacterium]